MPPTVSGQKYCCVHYINYQVAPNQYTGSSPATVTTRYIIKNNNDTVDNKAYNMFHTPSGYDEDRTVFNCPANMVAVTLVGMSDKTINDSEGATAGIFCAKLASDCRWVSHDAKSISGKANFTYYSPRNGYWNTVAYDYEGDCA